MFDSELSLELSSLTDVFQPTLVEFDLLVCHYPSCHTSLCCVIQTFGHLTQNFLHFFILVVELISSCHISSIEQTQSFTEIADVAKSDVNVQPIFL